MHSPWFWLTVTLICLAICTFLPIWIKNPSVRKYVSWFVLVPVSLILITYGYFVGIEVFRNIAINWK